MDEILFVLLPKIRLSSHRADRSGPTQLSNQEVRGFLSSLVVQRGVSASSQNQAFNALLFFFRHVLHREFGEIDGVVRARRHRYIPVVLSRHLRLTPVALLIFRWLCVAFCRLHTL